MDPVPQLHDAGETRGDRLGQLPPGDNPVARGESECRWLTFHPSEPHQHHDGNLHPELEQLHGLPLRGTDGWLCCPKAAARCRPLSATCSKTRSPPRAHRQCSAAEGNRAWSPASFWFKWHLAVPLLRGSASGSRKACFVISFRAALTPGSHRKARMVSMTAFALAALILRRRPCLRAGRHSLSGRRLDTPKAARRSIPRTRDRGSCRWRGCRPSSSPMASRSWPTASSDTAICPIPSSATPDLPVGFTVAE